MAICISFRFIAMEMFVWRAYKEHQRSNPNVHNSSSSSIDKKNKKEQVVVVVVLDYCSCQCSFDCLNWIGSFGELEPPSI